RADTEHCNIKSRLWRGSDRLLYAFIYRTVCSEWTEILLGSDNLQIIKNVIAQFGESETYSLCFERPCQCPHGNAGCCVDGGNDRAVDDHDPDSGRRAFDKAEDVAADKLGIEVEPGACATNHERARRISHIGIPGTIDILAGCRIASKNDNA